MAWVATETFDSYSTGNWSGNNGGTGFSTAWSGTLAEYLIVTTPTAGGAAAGNSNNTLGGGTGNVGRSMTTACTNGSFSYFVQTSTATAANGGRLDLFSNAESTSYFVDLTNTTLTLNSTGGNVTVMSGLSSATWYEINIEIDTSVPQYRARARQQGGTFGAFTAFKAPAGGSSTAGADEMFWEHLGTDATMQMYLDDIGPFTSTTTIIPTPQLLTLGAG